MPLANANKTAINPISVTIHCLHTRRRESTPAVGDDEGAAIGQDALSSPGGIGARFFAVGAGDGFKIGRVVRCLNIGEIPACLT